MRASSFGARRRAASRWTSVPAKSPAFQYRSTARVIEHAMRSASVRSSASTSLRISSTSTERPCRQIVSASRCPAAKLGADARLARRRRSVSPTSPACRAWRAAATSKSAGGSSPASRYQVASRMRSSRRRAPSRAEPLGEPPTELPAAKHRHPTPEHFGIDRDGRGEAVFAGHRRRPRRARPRRGSRPPSVRSTLRAVLTPRGSPSARSSHGVDGLVGEAVEADTDELAQPRGGTNALVQRQAVGPLSPGSPS